MFSRGKAICAALCFLSCSALSQTEANFNGYLMTFEKIASPASGIVNAILRDDRGFLWFGTTRGLCKFDGYRVRVISNGADLNTNRQVITVIMRFDREVLLLGTLQGVWKFNTRTEQFTPFLEGRYSEESITSLAQDSNTIWIGTSAHGLLGYARSQESVQTYSTESGLTDMHISSLLVDHLGRLWIGTLKGGLNMRGSTGQTFVVYGNNDAGAKTLWSNHITTLCEGEENELWVGTSDGLSMLNTHENTMRRLDLPSPGPHSIWTMNYEPSPTTGRRGTMWMAASELGLLSCSEGEFTELATSSDANRSLQSITLIYRDRVASNETNTLLWIGTRGGVDKILLSKNPFTSYIRSKNGVELNRGAAISLYEDREGILWVGLWGGGLNGLRRDHGSYRRVMSFEVGNSSSLPSNDVNSTIEDRSGNLWIGTTHGIFVLDKDRRHSATYRHNSSDSTSLPGDGVGQVYEDRSGNVWVCTSGGLARVIPGSPPQFLSYGRRSAGGPAVGQIAADVIFEDHGSRLWVATSGKGLCRIEGDTALTWFAEKTDASGRKENSISAAAEDSSGLFWLGTGAGLVSFDPRTGKFQRFPIAQLNDAYIIGILPDDRGYLWLSTKIGLVRYGPRDGSFVVLDEKYGMRFSELFSDFYRDNNGRVFVGGMDGFAEFSPASAFSASSPPEIAITGFSVFDRELVSALYPANSIRLSHDQNFFSFNFAALDYADPQRNKFAFRMVGVDDHWTDAGTRNYASYTNLDPGEYTFEVKGCNSLNVWNESGASFAITIAPAYWNTWWFRSLLVALFGSLAYTAYRYRLKKLLEMERLRLRIADDLHDDVGSNLSAIAMVSRSIHRSPGLPSGTKDMLAEIYDIAVATSEGMKDIVWFIKPRGDTLAELFARMKETALSMFGDAELDFETHVPDDPARISIEFKRDFFLAFKEILTNIAKHAGASKIEIQITQRDSAFELIVSDNGRGFDDRNVRYGNGIGSLRNRARNLRGRCEITSAPGKGTTVTFLGKL